MARKQNLSDLIQEEAQKLTPNRATDEGAIEVPAVPVVEQTASTEEESVTETSAKRNTPTKADLEATIKDLQTTLEQNQATEKALQKQIKNLQSTLSAEQASLERVTKELEETKKTALHLAEANSKLIEENKALQQPKASIVKQQPKEAYKPVVDYRKSHRSPDDYRKSHRSPDILPNMPEETKDDFAANTWLYD
jgi:chromosome segregation ATPase